MEISTLGSVVGIVMICYGIGLGCKASEKIPDKRIPVIMMICGGVLGIIGLYTMPGYPATDIINAIAVGMFNGLAANGPTTENGQVRLEKVCRWKHLRLRNLCSALNHMYRAKDGCRQEPLRM